MNLAAALILSSATLLGAAPAVAKVRAPPTDIAWTAAPGVDEVAAAFPKAAEGRTGEVALNCAFDAAGRLQRCETRFEAPRGMGFAQAALSLAGLFQGPANRPGARAQIAFKFDHDQLQAKAVARPEWVVLPTPAQFQAVFPDTASKAGVLKARAVMDCMVTATGGLIDCKPVSEEPAGYGLGAATLPLAAFFGLKVWTTDGLPVVGGVVRLPIRYDMKQAPAKP